jgi:hypothetical protein
VESPESFQLLLKLPTDLQLSAHRRGIQTERVRRGLQVVALSGSPLPGRHRSCSGFIELSELLPSLP